MSADRWMQPSGCCRYLLFWPRQRSSVSNWTTFSTRASSQRRVPADGAGPAFLTPVCGPAATNRQRAADVACQKPSLIIGPQKKKRALPLAAPPPSLSTTFPSLPHLKLVGIIFSRCRAMIQSNIKTPTAVTFKRFFFFLVVTHRGSRSRK